MNEVNIDQDLIDEVRDWMKKDADYVEDLEQMYDKLINGVAEFEYQMAKQRMEDGVNDDFEYQMARNKEKGVNDDEELFKEYLTEEIFGKFGTADRIYKAALKQFNKVENEAKDE